MITMHMGIINLTRHAMTKYSLILLLFFFQLGLSQDINSIKEGNVVFVYFDESIKEQKKITKASYEDNEDKKPYTYFFYFYNQGKVLEKVSLTFSFIIWTNKEKEQPQRFRVHKSFLRKNKSIIFTQNKMYSIGKEKILQTLEKAKTIYLIDESQKKDNTFLVKEVYYLDRRPI